MGRFLHFITNKILERRYVKLITENVSTLKIHKLTQAQYNREVNSGNIDANALYLTPEEEIDLSPYATIEYVNIRVPAWTSFDEGKFLRIVNGYPTWVAVPNAEGVGF